MSELDRTVQSMKDRANYLMRYSKTKEDEADLAILKQCLVKIDGYEVNVYFNKEHQAHFIADDDGGEQTEFDLLSLQIYSKYVPFLPFHLLFMLATKFLGKKELALSEFVIMGRKVYIWSVAIDPYGKAIPVPLHPHVERCSYEGVEYIHTPTQQIVMFPPPLPDL